VRTMARALSGFASWVMTTGHESAGKRTMDGVKQDSKEERHNAERDTGIANRTAHKHRENALRRTF